MKVRLEKAGQFVELVRFGRVVFCLDERGTESELGFFDDAAAEAALQVKLDGYRERGFGEPASVLKAQKQAKDDAAAKAILRATQLEKYQRLASDPNPQAAFAQLVSEVFADAPDEVAALCAQVQRLGDATEYGLTVYLTSGAEIDWAGDVVLFASPRSREENEPDLEYAVTGGPPLGDQEIADQVTGEITWFMSENIYNYWFFTSAEPSRARMWNHDGGIRPDDRVRTPEQALAARLLELSEKKG